MLKFARPLISGCAALTMVAALAQPAAARQGEPVTQDAWLHWLRDQERSFTHETARTALSVEMHANGPIAVDLTGVANADGSLSVTLASGGVTFAVRCVDDHSCWARQPTGGPDVLWHRIPAREMEGLRRALPDVDGLLGPGVASSVAGSTGRLDFDQDGVTLQATVSFAGGAFNLSERMVVPSDAVDVTITKSLIPVRSVVVRPPRATLIGSPMVKDVVPELP